MLTLMSEAGRSFLRAFVGSIVILGPGVLAAPSFHQAVLLGMAAVVASIAAGLKALQVFIPKLSFKSISALGIYYVYVDSFVRAFIAAFLTSIIGIFAMPTFGFSKSLIISVLIAAATAGVRAVQGLLTHGEPPAPSSGLTVPPQTPAGTPQA